MLLTITTTHTPATDLGYLLHKHPARVQTFELSFGKAHVFYPEVGDSRCTAALLLDVDPVGMVRGRRGPSGESGLLAQYVNDRPYVASSFMSVAISDVFSTAMAGRSKERAELVQTPIPLEFTLAVLPCRGGEGLLRRLFEPLGYTVAVIRHPLDEQFPEWGESPYYTVTLSTTARLSDALAHLYVLIPVLDNEKHYWIGGDEVEKLLKHGEVWLKQHPERELITERYLRRLRSLVRDAMDRLVDEEPASADGNDTRISDEEAIEAPISLRDHRLNAALSVLKAAHARRVIDLGCGEGHTLRALLKDAHIEAIAGMDVAHRTLEIAAERVRLDQMPESQRKRIQLFHGSLMYSDKRLKGYDAALVMEVIEHLDPPRLAAFERVLFKHARPGMAIITTPNVEYNIMWPTLPAGKMRHFDHRFEWTRAEFQSWAEGVAQQYGYRVRFAAVGPEDAAVGAPTQMGVFELVR